MVEFSEYVETCEWVKVEGSLHEAFFENDKIRNWTFDRMIKFLNRKEVFR